MKRSINLLPIDYRRRQLYVRHGIQWSAVWFVTLIVGSMFYWMEHAQNDRARSRLDSISRDYIPLKEMSVEVDGLKARIDELRKRESIVFSLADEQPVLTLVAILGRAAKECDGEVCIERMQLTRAAEGSGHGPRRVLTLDGLAANNQYVARFAAALRDAAAFESVELKSTGRREKDDVEAQSYSLECTF